MALGKTFQHPLTLLSTAAGLLGGLTLGLFGAATVTTAVTIGGLSIGLGSWALNYFMRKDILAAEHLQTVHAAMHKEEQMLLDSVRTDLATCTSYKNGRDHAEQAMTQFEMIQARFETFRSLISSKFRPGEFTAGRFLVSAEQVHLSVLDNLQGIANRLRSISTIDPAYTEERRAVLQSLDTLAEADTDELHTLDKRMQLLNEQLERINGILTLNERALTEFDRMNTSVAQMKGISDRATLDITSATEELQELAQRVKKLS
ncbi:MAG: hypothetical protein KKE76_08150 [Gammaproteobacteria bacterium]|nr:hypothetical protein [Gammaproteobacteria bacterium]